MAFEFRVFRGENRVSQGIRDVFVLQEYATLRRELTDDRAVSRVYPGDRAGRVFGARGEERLGAGLAQHHPRRPPQQGRYHQARG